VLLPGGADAAVIRLRSLESFQTDRSQVESGVAATVDCNPRYVYLHPYEGAKAAVAEAARNLSCVGAQPLAVTDNLNFGSPEKPIGYWQLAEACRGLAEACRALATPVTGGNVSLYNETFDADGNPQPIYPTPVVGMVGLIEDLRRVCGQGWQSTGDLIYLLGIPIASEANGHVTLGGSEYLASLHNTVAGMPPLVDLTLEQRVQAACRHGIEQGWVHSAHDCAEGGLAIALAESCISGDRGAEIRLPAVAAIDQRWDQILFGEGGARICLSVGPEFQSLWESYLKAHVGENWQAIGQVRDKRANLEILTSDNLSLIKVTIDLISECWGEAIANQMMAE
jgi:phosphoribosylformylglycinamidine synthase subunit PurL